MIRIGLLGASRIAPPAVIEPANRRADVTVTAVAGRDQDRTAAYALKHSIAHAVDSYQALVDRSDIDLVYNALPPSTHKQWTIAALEAGKHVLCEKPFAMNGVEAEQMVAAAQANNRCLVEAFHYRYHPLFERLVALTKTGAIGQLQQIDGEFSAPIRRTPNELRYQRELGGGALMDLGCYPLHWVRAIGGNEPEIVSAQGEFDITDDGNQGVDISLRAQLMVGDITASITCSMAPEDNGVTATLTIIGDAGRIEVDNPLAPQNRHELRLVCNGEVTTEQFGDVPTYDYQLQATIDAMSSGRPALTSGADTIGQMKAIDAIYQQARS